MVDLSKIKGIYTETKPNPVGTLDDRVIEKGLQYGDTWFPIIEAHYVVNKNAIGLHSIKLSDCVLDFGTNPTVGKGSRKKIVYYKQPQINTLDRLEWFYKNTDRYDVDVIYKTNGIVIGTKREQVVIPITNQQLIENIERGYTKTIPVTELYASAKAIDDRLLKACDGVPYMKVYKTADKPTGSHIYWVQITGIASTGEDIEPWVLVQAGEHTREMICTDIAINWIEEMAKTQPRKNVIVVPMACINRDVCRESDPCQRSYPNGEDSNRNWGLPKGITMPSDFSNCPSCQGHVDSTKSGYATTLNNRLLLYIGGEYNVETFVNVHSGEFAIYSGLDCTTYELPNHKMGQDFIKELSLDCPECKVGDPAKISYAVYGSTVDHFLTAVGVKHAFTFEVYGGNTALHGQNKLGCYATFNPTTKINFDFQVARWTRILHNIVNSTYHLKE